MDLEEELKIDGGEPVEDRPRYVIRDAAYALLPHEPIEWVIEKFISAGSVSVFFGDPGSKKTWSVLSLAVRVALGKEFLGFATPKPRKVLIIDEEMGESRLTLRLAAALRGEFGDDSTPVQFVSLAGFMLDDKDDQAELEKLVATTGAELVIIDALSDIMSGDEDKKKDTQPIFTALRRIADKHRAAIIMVHHSNRSGGYRGSSAIKGAADLLIRIESKEGSGWVEFESEKTRDIEALRIKAVATWTDSQFYLSQAEDIKNAPKRYTSSQRYVIGYLKKNGASPMPNIMGASDRCEPATAKKAVYELVNNGLAYRTNPEDTGRGAIAIYDLTKEGKDVVIE